MYGHESRLRRCTIQLDGFVSVQAPFRGGEVVTKLIVSEGDELRINFSTSAAGSLQVELQDANENPLPAFSLENCIECVGNNVQHAVRWKNGGDVGRMAGQPVCLRFVMNDADLYSFHFEPKSKP